MTKHKKNLHFDSDWFNIHLPFNTICNYILLRIFLCQVNATNKSSNQKIQIPV